MADERPVHVVLADGGVSSVPVGDTEWAEMRARDTAAAEEASAAEDARRADLAAVAERAARDPAIAALVRLIGITLPAAAPAAPASSGTAIERDPHDAD